MSSGSDPPEAARLGGELQEVSAGEQSSPLLSTAALKVAWVGTKVKKEEPAAGLRMDGAGCAEDGEAKYKSHYSFPMGWTLTGLITLPPNEIEEITRVSQTDT